MFEKMSKDEVLKLKVGDTVFYQSQLTEHPTGTYIGKIIANNKNFFTLKIRLLQDSNVGEIFFGPSSSYVIGVHKANIGITDNFSIRGVIRDV